MWFLWVNGRARCLCSLGAADACVQCVVYLARKKVACHAIARDTDACERAVRSTLPPPFLGYVSFHRADVTDEKTLEPALRGCTGVIFAATATAGWTLFESKETPPAVDFGGSVAAATAAAAVGVPRFVLISSLAVTRPSHMMHMARNSLMGRIMDWKLLGEQGVCKVYDTMARSSTSEFSVTIVRPGTLTDEPGGGPGCLLVDTGDNLSGSISRADVAALCVEVSLVAFWNARAKPAAGEACTRGQVCLRPCSRSSVVLCFRVIVPLLKRAHVCPSHCVLAHACSCVPDVGGVWFLLACLWSSRRVSRRVCFPCV